MEKYRRSFLDSFINSGTYGRGKIKEMGAVPFKEELQEITKDASAVRYVEWVDQKGVPQWRYVVFGKRENGKIVDDRSYMRIYGWGDKGWVQDSLATEEEQDRNVVPSEWSEPLNWYSYSVVN